MAPNQPTTSANGKSRILVGLALLALALLASKLNANKRGLRLFEVQGIEAIGFDLNEPAPAEEDELEAQDDNSIEVQEDKRQNSTSVGWARRFRERVADRLKLAFSKMPKYFDFSAYMAQFNRHYKPGELLYRKATFLRTCLEVFKSRVAYRLGASSYRRGVNSFADRSPNEVGRMYMSAPPFEMRPPGQSEEEYLRKMETLSEERAQWDLELASSAGGEDEENPSQVVHESQARRRLEAMVLEGAGDPQMGAAVAQELEEEVDKEESEEERARWRPLPWPGQLKAPDIYKEEEGMGDLQRPYAPPDLKEGDQLDWSRHKCFHTVYDQGSTCGKCYVMASTALAEFYKCSEQQGKPELRKFSKDYVLHCARKFAPTIWGCQGGSLIDTLRFIATAGIHSITSWSSTRQERLKQAMKAGLRLPAAEARCPLNRFEEPFEQWGRIKVELEPRVVSPSRWHEALQDGPLVASVQMPAVGVTSYEGGVHDGEGCERSENWHAMLLVGYGRDHLGRPFWRFRNSWGPKWGLKGHFDLAMSVPDACLAGGVRVYRR